MINTGDKLKNMLNAAHQHATRTVERADSAGSDTGTAAQLYIERRRRAAWFDAGLFWEPAWDLLLYLYDATESGRGFVTIDRAVKACDAVTESSARRWINLLIAHDYVHETKEAAGSATHELRLSEKGRRAMAGYLREFRTLGQLA